MRRSNLRTSSTSGHLKCRPGWRSLRTILPRLSTIAVCSSETMNTELIARITTTREAIRMPVRWRMSAAPFAAGRAFGADIAGVVGAGIGADGFYRGQLGHRRRAAGASGGIDRQVENVVVASGQHLRIARQHCLHGFQVQAFARDFRRLAVLRNQLLEATGI